MPGSPTPRGKSSPFLTVCLGYRDIWAGKPTWPGLAAGVEQYQLSALLDVVGKLSAALWHVTSRGGVGSQLDLMRAVFGPRTQEILRRVSERDSELRQQGHTGATALFHNLQLANFVKLALVIGVRDPASPRDINQHLGEDLLMLNDLVGLGFASPRSHATQKLRSRDGWHYNLVTHSLAQYTGNVLHALARAYHLSLEDQVDLRSHPLYMDLPRRIENAIGLRPQDLWCLAFALIGYWSKFKVPDPPQEAGSVSRSTHFTRAFDLTTEELDRFFGLLTIDLDVLVQQVRDRYTLTSIRPLDLLPLARRPLVQAGDRVYCPSFPLLLSKLTTGLHHLHLDRALFPSDAERSRYLNYSGVVFEHYVDKVISAPESMRGARYVSECELRSGIQGKRPEQGTRVCDGLLVYGTDVIAFEAKAALLTLEARAGEDWNSYREKVNSIVIDALKQVFATIRAIQRGQIQVAGVSSKATFYPLIITLEPLVLYPYVYRELDNMAGRKGVRTPDRTRYWQLSHIEEFEMACCIEHNGGSFIEILKRKTSTRQEAGESFVNYCWLSNQQRLLTPHPALARTLERIGDNAVAWLRSRARERNPGEISSGEIDNLTS